MIQKLLIANRGEIAVRIIRACKELGIKTVAIYSTADAEALHVQLADEAICVGEPQVKRSYLHQNNIITAALLTKCDAIHPGYGFLSENATFAKSVQSQGLTFVGPSPEIIATMGNKAEARRLMQEAGVPIVPGTTAIANVEDALVAANQIGYPLLIKASSGGGGRGMRIARSEEEFSNCFQSAKSEAKVAFGDDQVYLEKLIENPKHIEVQIIGDHHGNVVHLFERDCSLQRRNQKMLEEAPCHSLSSTVRSSLLNDAIKASKHVGYDSVGTIEFVLDQQQNYYFIEMNTRVQVEHPITEMITNIDIVKQQIRIACGQTLSIHQDDIKPSGYAMECRINAEDMERNFAPSCGEISFLHLPGGKGVRIDSALYAGCVVSPFYDSMLLKLIVFAPTRLECIKKMRVALEELMIEGIKTNIEFHYMLLHHKSVIDGKYDTSFIQTFLEEYHARENNI